MQYNFNMIKKSIECIKKHIPFGLDNIKSLFQIKGSMLVSIIYFYKIYLLFHKWLVNQFYVLQKYIAGKGPLKKHFFNSLK